MTILGFHVPLAPLPFSAPTVAPNPPRLHRRPCMAVSPPRSPIARSLPQIYPAHVTSYPIPVGEAAQSAATVRSVSSLPHLFIKLAQLPNAHLTALNDPHHQPPLQLSFAQFAHQICQCTAGLRLLGLRPKSIVSLFSENSARWAIVDQAIMAAGAAAAVRGVSAPPKELAFIMTHSDSSVLFVENISTLKTMITAAVDFSPLQFIVLLYGHAAPAKHLGVAVPIHSFEDVMQLGSNYTPDLVTVLPKRTDTATLLYTSGTTGNPKGVLLTHSNLLAQLEDISLATFDPLPGHIFLSILPCWHIFERTAGYWSLSKGVNIVYSDKRRFREDLQKYKPHMLIAVPRVFENLHASVTQKLSRASLLRRSIAHFFIAISMAFINVRRRLNSEHIHAEPPRNAFEKFICALQLNLLIPFYALANLLLWRKIRQGLGGQLRICLSGGGSIAGYLEDFFECAGINICVGYGMTETSPVIANRFSSHNVRGSTGTELPRAYLKIAHTETGKPVPFGQQGNLSIKGPYVFSKYWKDAVATAKVFDADGYFDTGDLAYRVAGGYIVISGRSKDIVVLTNGENIEPAPIEDAILASSLIDQITLVGQDEKALGAIIVPNAEALESNDLVEVGTAKRIAKLVQDEVQNRDELRKLEEKMCQSVKLVARFRGEVEKYNKEREAFSSNDRVMHFHFVLTPFSVENGMLTQTLKVKRNVVADVYREEISSMYKK